MKYFAQRRQSMRKQSFSFDTQLSIGEAGVRLAKMVLRAVYPHIRDLEFEWPEQERGIDLYVYELGFVEVKTDTHSPKNFFLELSSDGKPGAIDRSCADYFCIIFPYARVMYLLPRPELQMWLRDNIQWIDNLYKGWITTVKSHSRGRQWNAIGLVVPIWRLQQDLDIVQIKWNEEDEIIKGVWK